MNQSGQCVSSAPGRGHISWWWRCSESGSRSNRGAAVAATPGATLQGHQGPEGWAADDREGGERSPVSCSAITVGPHCSSVCTQTRMQKLVARNRTGTRKKLLRSSRPWDRHCWYFCFLLICVFSFFSLFPLIFSYPRNTWVDSSLKKVKIKKKKKALQMGLKSPVSTLPYSHRSPGIP